MGAGVPDGEVPEAQARDREAVKETRKEKSMSHLNYYPFFYSYLGPLWEKGSVM